MFKKFVTTLGIIAFAAVSLPSDAMAGAGQRCLTPTPGNTYRPGSSGCNTRGGTAFACGNRSYTIEPAVPKIWIDKGRLKNTSTNVRRNYVVRPGEEFTVRYAPPAGRPSTALGISEYRADGVENASQICASQALQLTCPEEGCILGKYSVDKRKGYLQIWITAKRPHSKAPVNMIGDAILYVVAKGDAPAEVPFVNFDGPTTVRVGQQFAVTASTSGSGLSRLISSGWTGPIDPIEYLGSGYLPTSGVTWGGMLHANAAGTAQVTLTLSNNLGKTKTYTHTIKVVDSYRYANCDIVGPSVVSVGQPFNVTWTDLKPKVSSQLRVRAVSQAFANSIAVGSLNRDSGSWNGLTLSQPGRYGIALEAYSNYGYESICTYFVDAQ